jgi:AbrB family looped-hinge helix DNA binding protein
MAHTSSTAHTEPESHDVAVGERGRVVIPAELRRILGIGRGSTLVARVEGGRRLVLEDRKSLVAEMRGAWLRPGALKGSRNSRGELTSEVLPASGALRATFSATAAGDLTDELLAERRAEAALEDAKVAGDEKAVARARRQLGELQRRHDGQQTAQ